jgi:hypothetical protein
MEEIMYTDFIIKNSKLVKVIENGQEEITIPDGVKTIGNEAFSECDLLDSVVIPLGLTSIGDFAFSECNSLTSIIIPKSVKKMGEGVFSGCDKLKIYCEANSKPVGWDENWNSNNLEVYWGANKGNNYQENGLCYLLKNGI